MEFHRKQKSNPIVVANIEKKLIDKNYQFLECRIEKGILYCYGEYKPTSESTTYSYRIKYDPLDKPKVKVMKPVIAYNDDIHLYPKDNTLCLYHKTDLIWNTSCHLYDTIIPWTHEWFVFYELYQLTGKWLHPFVSHRKGNKK
ncbi:MAG: hypothetical protein ACI8Q1_002867 [Parvicella sp.]|jgi:hypothetical protein